MTKIQKAILTTFSIALMVIAIPVNVLVSQTAVSERSAVQKLESGREYFEAPDSIIEESIFPDNYPDFLKQLYIFLRQAERLKTLSASDRESFLKGQAQEPQEFFRAILKDDELSVQQLCNFTRAQVGEKTFEAFLKRFGINRDNYGDIELEVLAQIKRMRRNNNASGDLANRIDLIKLSMVPRELEYALRYCDSEEFQTLLDIVTQKPGFGPRTSQDRDCCHSTVDFPACGKR
jgi:hypothetical protein